MQVSLARPHRPTVPPSGPLLAAEARVVLGGLARGALVAPVRPAADSLFGPRGAGLAAPAGPLFVCDTGHHRLLVWQSAPSADGTPADFVIGQTDFKGEARNGGGGVGPATLNMPTGLAVAGDVLAVADAWNHRVLLWHGLPRSRNQPADIVLGQADFTGGTANRGGDPAADTLNWCYGVALCDGRLIVADTGNRRVLVWDRIPDRTGAPADLVLGQPDMAHRDDHGAGGLRWPHAAAMADRLFVADAGTSRILVWPQLPDRDGAPWHSVLGQADAQGLDHNRGGYDPTAATLNMPYGLASLAGGVVVADTANSRLLGFRPDIATGLAADRLAGQHSFQDKGENRWHGPDRDSLCWPYGVSVCGHVAAVADSGNNRVLLWDLA
jgi:hypothetical protein